MDVAGRQIISTRQPRGAWDRYSSHRGKILELVRNASAGRGGRLCVLGAGNCNDLDLSSLAQQFSKIHLLDLDREALEGGVARQSFSQAGRVVLDALCDLKEASIDELGGYYDVVLSSGLLTQMFQTIEDRRLDENTELEVVLALRTHHLRLLFDLVAPGGAFVLSTDVVSTATAPELRNCPEALLSGRLAKLIEARNFVTGAHPSAIWKELTEQPEFADQCARIDSHHPC